MSKTVVALGVVLGTLGTGVATAGDMALYKVVSARDEVVIGVDVAAAAEVGPLAERLAKNGYLVAWQYGPARGEGGATVQKPLRRIAVFAGQVIRIEPFVSDQPIVAPAK
ncbi:MAG: hypothetical protein PHQ14_08430 [Chromatiales bacterium]|nr:hypothetical protein [Chromatiales bacterium]MDX9766889.1 hypothetical protein [Ectothiorhodospiraceae bacterium]